MTAVGDRALAETAGAPLTARLGAALLREHSLFLTATGAITLHLVDDSFLQPEAGTAAGDHLVSGLVPTFALLGAAWAYPRLRPGLRATVAVFLGAVGVVAGASEGGYHTITGGPSGDDYTGLLALLAGVLLIAVGAVTLWRTRRLAESRRRRYIRRSDG